MKITKFAYKDFLGTESLEDVPGKVNVLLAGNGAGKTTYIKALRFALTGELPSGDVIRSGADSLYTFVEVEGNTIERIKGDTSKTLLNCRSTTKKSLDELYRSMGLKTETARVLTSSQVLGSMSAEELSGFLLESGLIPVAVDIDRLISLCKPDSPDVESEMRAYFPASPDLISIEDIAEAYSSYYGGRRSISSDLRIAKANCSGFTSLKPPEMTVEEVDKKISEYEKLSDSKAIAAYNEAVMKKDRINRQIADLEAKIADITAAEPDSVRYRELKTEQKHYSELRSSNSKTMAVLTNMISNTEDTLKALSGNTCPLHSEIICTADKASLIEKLNDTLSSAKNDLSEVEQETAELDRKLTEATNSLDEFVTEQKLYEEKRTLIKQIELLTSGIPDIPDKPAISDEEAEAAENKLLRLREYRKYIISYNSQKAEYERMLALSDDFARYDAMVELLSPKSGIREAVLGMAAETLVQECNRTASELGLPITLIIKADKGLRVLASTDRNGYHNFNSLSNGEKVIVELLIMDVLNKLTGFNMLVLDNLDSLDSRAFSKVLSLVSSSGFRERYDHIFLSGVDHADLMDEITKYDVHRVVF